MKLKNLSYLTALHLHSQFFRQSGPKLIQTIQKILSLLFWLLTAVIVFTIAVYTPDMDLRKFWDHYFEHSLAGFSAVIIIWLIGSLLIENRNPAELKNILSLPLSGSDYFDYQISTELKRKLWIPLLTSALYFMCISTVPFIIPLRLSIISFMFLILSLAIKYILKNFIINISDKTQKGGDEHYLPAVLTIFSFLILHILLLMESQIITGKLFIIFPCAAFIIFLTLRYIFEKTFYINRQLSFNSQEKTAGRWKRDPLNLFTFKNRTKFPLAGKNLLFIIRKQMNGAFGIITLIFIFLSVLFAFNNQESSARVDLLLALIVLYFLGMSFHIQSFLSEKNESLQMVYALPVNKILLYSGLIIPGLIKAAVLSSLYFIVISISGIELKSGVEFFIKSFLLGTAFLNSAVIEAVQHYPDEKKVQKKYTTSLFALGIALILFYPYWIYLICLWSLISLFKLKKHRPFYKNRI